MMKKGIKPFKNEDFCPICKSVLTVMKTEHKRVERQCRTCKAIVVDTEKNEDK
jgi:DNA-directed RNA polymerase subunit M/transcription elongation factor TFIIS